MIQCKDDGPSVSLVAMEECSSPEAGLYLRARDGSAAQLVAVDEAVGCAHASLEISDLYGQTFLEHRGGPLTAVDATGVRHGRSPVN